MKSFSDDIISYIHSKRIGVLAVEMLDGSPHGATVHFAYDEQKSNFLYETYATYKKAEPLLKNKTTRATFVIGQDENDMKTLQIDGIISLIQKKEDIESFEQIYLKKFPEKLEKYQDSSQYVLFSFIPKWWRFTDWTTAQGKIIFNSEEAI